MIENPFASPRIVDPAVDVDSLPLMVRRPWAMLLAGMFLGGVIGATAGGVTSGTIGFVAVVSGSDIRDPDPDIKSAAKPPAIAVVVIGAFLGAFQGGWMGVVVGGVAGLISGIATPLRIAVPMWTAAVLAAIGGGFFGGVAAAMVLGDTAAIVAGAILAGGAGVLAGAFLGRTIATFAVRRRSAAGELRL
ncbi:MAG: hypothetical protein DCC68_08700 [Planctomycetota bacterium]|nr:MAG: hypothetical protein DCC68_08700 [Planctomycetota bacterium]